ncbi:Ubiquitin-fold modifier-conjugating enzyme [Melia azedarach]|uniref:Ubiquitin-fold modifier-conjugating enzyme n=2 Tax=Melia azedarach TaxID=155640 RepID=A0ACC1Y2V3_MELAZ|nr:Ubiquitin-fold modifier-conjugating enzyme [Melia azedarach]KAJ4717706.1 Ubiquitin-fold modifier-conjugating enzyme [Melia azedarach]
MKNSPTLLNYEASDYGVHEFDPQVDFSQFLEEARQHAREVNFQASSRYSEESEKGKSGEHKKIKKSWKKCLFSWFKVEKKSKPGIEPENTSHISKPKKGHVSGPIYGSFRGDDTRQRRPSSGPIASFLNPIRKIESEIPYMCLDQLDNPHHVRSYAPVYLVT